MARSATDPQERRTATDRLIVAWGVLGVAALITDPIVRLTPVALDSILDFRLTSLQWAVCLAWIVVAAYVKGHRAFHRRFSPRVVARAFFVASNPTPVRIVLAPLFCMGLFHASRRVFFAAWILIAAIVMLVVWIHSLAQPWRGIVDAGVVVGLTWGVLSLLWHYARAEVRGEIPSRTDLPPAPQAGRAPRA